jgi:hypothetical protein
MIQTTQEESIPMSAPLLPTPTLSGRKQQLRNTPSEIKGM